MTNIIAALIASANNVSTEAADKLNEKTYTVSSTGQKVVNNGIVNVDVAKDVMDQLNTDLKEFRFTMSSRQMNALVQEVNLLRKLITKGNFQVQYKGYSKKALIEAYNRACDDNNVTDEQLTTIKAMIDTKTKARKKINQNVSDLTFKDALSTAYEAKKVQANAKANSYAKTMMAKTQYKKPVTIQDTNESYVTDLETLITGMEADQVLDVNFKQFNIIRKGKLHLGAPSSEFNKGDRDAIRDYLAYLVSNGLATEI